MWAGLLSVAVNYHLNVMGGPRKITAISPQKRNPHRRSVFLNGEFAFGLSEEVIEKYRLRVGSEIDEETITQILEKDEVARARDSALRYLSYRPRSKKEVIDKLSEKGYNESTIAKVIEDLIKAGLIDDLEFSRMWARDRLKNRPKGRRLIAQELWQKGVADEISRRAIEEVFRDVDEGEIAATLLERRLRRYRDLDQVRAKRRMFEFLLRRGFDRETIGKVVAEAWRKLEDEVW